MTEEKETGVVPNINEVKFGCNIPLQLLHNLFKISKMEYDGLNAMLVAIGDFQDPQNTCGYSPEAAYFNCSVSMLKNYTAYTKLLQQQDLSDGKP